MISTLGKLEKKYFKANTEGKVTSTLKKYLQWLYVKNKQISNVIWFKNGMQFVLQPLKHKKYLYRVKCFETKYIKNKPCSQKNLIKNHTFLKKKKIILISDCDLVCLIFL